jgi:hypothetical protein
VISSLVKEKNMTKQKIRNLIEEAGGIEKAIQAVAQVYFQDLPKTKRGLWLSETETLVVALSEDYFDEDIAEFLGCSISTVHINRYRAKKKMENPKFLKEEQRREAIPIRLGIQKVTDLTRGEAEKITISLCEDWKPKEIAEDTSLPLHVIERIAYRLQLNKA